MYLLEKDGNNMKRAALTILLASSILFSGCDPYEHINDAEVVKIEKGAVRDEYVITLNHDGQEKKFSSKERRVRMVEVGNKVDVTYSTNYMEIIKLNYSKKGGK